MVKVTLEFTSVDEALLQLAKLSTTPLDAAAGLVSIANDNAAAVQRKLPAPSVENEAKEVAVAKKQPAAAPTAQVATPAPAVSSTAAAEPTVDYATLQKAVFALANASRQAAVAVMDAFKVKSFKELKEEQWSPALTAVKLKLESLKEAA